MGWKNQTSSYLETNEDRFWKKVEKTDGCWLWTGSKQTSGQGKKPYGSFRFKGGWLAHRFSWILHKGPIPKDMLVCHHCDNHSCVNPKHLFLGTQQDNMDDMKNKGRRNGYPRVKLTWEDVHRMRRLYATGKILQKTLVRIFNVSKSTICNIINNRERKVLEV